MKRLITQLWVTSLFCLALGRALDSGLCPLKSNPETEPEVNPNCKFILPESEIICDGENITQWEFDSFLSRKFRTLRINGTLLSEIPACALYDLEIETVIIENNPNLKDIHIDAFHHLKGVTNILVNGNGKLDLKNPFAVFRTLETLTNLVLENNFIQGKHGTENLQHFVYNLKSLQHLSLGGNPLQKITDFFMKPLIDSNLHTMNLKDCYLEKIENGKHFYLRTCE